MKKLVSWSLENFSALPWRGEKRSLYTTLVSEIMLQQTTVATVLNRFDSFIQRFPDVYSLARASDTEVRIAWTGLGYYRRAVNLKKACEYIAHELKGKIPLEHDVLTQIPGIGRYTANALIGIGANQKALALDANLERVLARYYAVDVVKGPKLQSHLYEMFEEGKIFSNEMDKLGSRHVNEALMDLGRVYCKSQKAVCELCPLSIGCKAFKMGKSAYFPVVLGKEAAKQKRFDLKLLRIVIIKNNKLLSYQKNSNEWLSGQWEVPTFILHSDDKKCGQYPWSKEDILGLKMEDFAKLKSFKTSITKYRITNYVLPMKESAFKKILSSQKCSGTRFQSVLEYRLLCSGNENFSTATLKLLRIMGLQG